MLNEIIMILIIYTNIGVTSQQIKFNDIQTCVEVGNTFIRTSAINQRFDFRCIKTTKN